MRIGILGAGSFGTSLAKNLASFSNSKHNITIYCNREEIANEINTFHTNSTYLPNAKLPLEIFATTTITDLYKTKLIILVTPVKFIKNTIKLLTNFPKHIPLLIASKGIETEEEDLLSNIVHKELGNINIGILTGPSFATEIAENLVSSLILATHSHSLSTQIINDLNFSTIRMYQSEDIIGCQIGGAIKNIIAIAAGISKGLNLGHNALAALITRGTKEISTIISAFGGNPITAYGLSGLGDLVLTATSLESRNFSLGLAIAKNNGYTPNIKKGKFGIAEGIYTAKAIFNISQKKNIYTPICQEVYKVLYCNKDPRNSIKDLLCSSIKSEF